MVSTHWALKQEPHLFINKWHRENREERARDKPSVYLGSNPRYDNTGTLKNLSVGT